MNTVKQLLASHFRISASGPLWLRVTAVVASVLVAITTSSLFGEAHREVFYVWLLVPAAGGFCFFVYGGLLSGLFAVVISEAILWFGTGGAVGYTFAMAAHGVPCGVDWQDMELARSPQISDFARRVEYTVNTEYGEKQACRVEITTYDGQTFKEERDFMSLHVMTEDELLQKYQHNARRILTEQQVGRSVEYFRNLEELPKVSLLAAQLT